VLLELFAFPVVPLPVEFAAETTLAVAGVEFAI
jgi:hypothetical protein